MHMSLSTVYLSWCYTRFFRHQHSINKYSSAEKERYISAATLQLGQNGISTRDSDTRCRLDTNISDLEIVDHHGETLGSNAETTLGGVHGQTEGLSESTVAITSHNDLALVAANLAESIHNETVNQGHAHNLIDTLGLKRVGSTQETGNVVFRAGRSEGT